MHNYSDYAAIELHRARQREVMERAEAERVLRESRMPIERRVRRTVRINNNPVR